MQKVILLTILLVVLVPCVDAQQSHIYVRVNIEAPPDVEDQITSHIKRELRAFADVAITDEDADFVLSIIVIDAVIGQTKSGFFMSGVFLYPFTDKTVDSLAYDLPASAKNSLASRTKGMLGYIKHYIRSGSNLKAMCQDVVVQFDKYALEKRRH